MNKFSSTEIYKNIAWVLIVLGSIILIVTIALFLKDNFKWLGTINTEEFSRFGSFSEGLVGVLFSLAGILLVLATLSEQRMQFKNLQEQSEKQQIENHFFQLLKINQDEKLRINIANDNENDKFGALLNNFGSILESTRENLGEYNLKIRSIFHI